MSSYETLLYSIEDAVATITLNRPEALNTIVPPMPDEVEDAVERATRDVDVKVLVIRGAGRAFCAGYDFGDGLRHFGDSLKQFDSAIDPTRKFASVWRTPKPVIAQVHGWCVGGGSDLAPCPHPVAARAGAVLGPPLSPLLGAHLSGM